MQTRSWVSLVSYVRKSGTVYLRCEILEFRLFYKIKRATCSNKPPNGKIEKCLTNKTSTAKEHFNKLIQFRQAAYSKLGTAKDVLFELGDAAISTPAANSFAELSYSRSNFGDGGRVPMKALQDGRPDRKSLMQLYCRNIKVDNRPTLVGDHTA